MTVIEWLQRLAAPIFQPVDISLFYLLLTLASSKEWCYYEYPPRNKAGKKKSNNICCSVCDAALGPEELPIDHQAPETARNKIEHFLYCTPTNDSFRLRFGESWKMMCSDHQGLSDSLHQQPTAVIPWIQWQHLTHTHTYIYIYLNPTICL